MTTAVSEEAEVLPALFEHCQTVYDRMEKEAVLEDGALIWKGHLTKLFAAEHLSVPYYTSVTRELKRMGCISQKRRGGGNAPSEWWIRMSPTEELWRDESTNTGNLSTRRRTREEGMQQQINDLARRLLKVEEDNTLIIEMLQEKEHGH